MYQDETIVITRESPEEKKHKGEIMCLSYETIDDNDYILSSSVDSTLKIWDLEGKDAFKNIQTLVGHSGTVKIFYLKIFRC